MLELFFDLLTLPPLICTTLGQCLWEAAVQWQPEHLVTGTVVGEVVEIQPDRSQCRFAEFYRGREVDVELQKTELHLQVLCFLFQFLFCGSRNNKEIIQNNI